MPPQPKFTREEIVALALELVSERGIDALTARSLGEKMGSSPRPIFTAFKSMEEVKDEVMQAAQKKYYEMQKEPVKDAPKFKQFGVNMVKFASQEPKLFALLFMQKNEKAHTFADVFEMLGIGAVESIKTIEETYGLEADTAGALFRQVWIFTYGIAVLTVNGVCDFSEEEVSQMLTENFHGALNDIHSRQNQE